MKKIRKRETKANKIILRAIGKQNNSNELA